MLQTRNKICALGELVESVGWNGNGHIKRVDRLVGEAVRAECDSK